MVSYPHELTECEECGAHYCMGCSGEECPNCKLQKVAFYAIELEEKLKAVKTRLNTKPDSYNKRGSFTRSDFVLWRAQALKILEDS